MCEGGYTHLVLCARDCYLLYDMVDALFGEKARYAITYFYTSRLTRYRPSDTYKDYAQLELDSRTLVVDMNGSGNSLKFLTDQFGATPLLVVSHTNVVPSLVHGGLRETSNLAPHAMVADVKFVNAWIPDPQFVNPANINWDKPEIKVMDEAFLVCLRTLGEPPYPAPTYTLDYALSKMPDPATECLWADHLADSKAAYDLLNSGPLPHPVIL